jgi:hypothetical protein
VTALIMRVDEVTLEILKSNPPKFTISAKGTTNTGGWSNGRLDARLYLGGTPPDGIQGFDFVADAPTGENTDALSPISTQEITLDLPKTIRGIRIYAATNSIEKLFTANPRAKTSSVRRASKAANEIQAPTALSGVLSPLTGSGYCMDGATHLIHTPIGASRLKATNDEAHKALVAYESGTTRVTVIGFQAWGPECMHIAVYHVAESEQLMKLQDDRFVPFPWSRPLDR